MIDLISDTITMPSKEMLETILSAPLGDAGRENREGRGEDKATNQLEDLAAELTGKESGAFFPTGTMGNTAAILSVAKRGDTVLVETRQHILVSEKICFEEEGFGMHPVCYTLQPGGDPDVSEIERLLDETKAKLLCIENTHNFSGGTCMSVGVMKKIWEVCKARGVHVHLDGARLFNAAESLGVSPAEICQYCDSVMFCVSKGLGAPIGSVVCAGTDFIQSVRGKRKLLGGTMRQSGVAASCGIYALRHNVKRLAEDHENTRETAELLGGLKKLCVDTAPQSNILLFDLRRAGITGAKFCELLLQKGVRGSAVSETEARLVFHEGIVAEDAPKIAQAVLAVDAEL